MALLTQEAQGHMHRMKSGLPRGNWPGPLHVLEAAQPTPSPSSAEVTLGQSEPPWASGSQLQGQLWGLSVCSRATSLRHWKTTGSWKRRS